MTEKLVSMAANEEDNMLLFSDISELQDKVL